jgi:hypothetical protein
MDELLNALGWAAFGPVLVLTAPLVVAGLMLRAAARRRAEALAATLATRRRAADVASGAVAVHGRWRALDGRDGLVEDDDGAAIRVTREPDAAAIADGARVLVIGCAVGQVDDPRGGGYRGQARLPEVRVAGAGQLVTTDVERLERSARRARLAATAGATLFALALAVALAAAVVAWRAMDCT